MHKQASFLTKLFNLSSTLKSFTSNNHQFSALPIMEKDEINLYTKFFLCLFLCKVFKALVIGIFSLSQMLIVSFIFGVLLLFLCKKKLLYVKIIYFIWSSVASFVLIHIAQAKSMVLVVPLYALIQPTYCHVVCRSITLSLFCLTINLGTIMYSYWPEVITIFNTIPGELRYTVLSMHTLYCVELSFHFIILWGYLFTSRKKYMMELHEKQKKLDDLNSKLESMKADLLLSLKSKENFLLSVSHELRNPLNSVSGNIELCLMHQNSTQVKTYLDSARASCEMLSHLINNLLDSGKMEKSSLEVTEVPTNIRALLEKMWGNIKVLIQKKGLQGGLYVARNVPKIIMTDAHRIMQIIMNLVTNSVKFTEKGSIKIVISWLNGTVYSQSLLNSRDTEIFTEDSFENMTRGPEDPCHDYISDYIVDAMDFEENLPLANSIDQERIITTQQIGTIKTMKSLNFESKFDKLDLNCSHLNSREVSSLHNKTQESNREGFFKITVIDSGCGLTEHDLQKLFMKFSHTGNENTNYLGTGLGLWITKSLCQTMGGGITASSQRGRGSVFTVVLKCEENTQRVETNSIKARMTPTHRPLNAMVVDDAESNLQIIVMFLKKCGVNVSHTACNGLDALRIFKSQKEGFFDCIFMDLEMPKMDGRTACKEIRIFEEVMGWKPSTITIVSANYTPSEFELCTGKNGGIRADYMFAKPFTLTQCKNLVDILESKRYISCSNLEDVKSILIVDDDPNNCKLLMDVFQNQEVKTMVASNGMEALSKFKANHQNIKAVYMDCEIPLMDSCAVTRYIKKFLKDNQLADIPVFGLTGDNSSETMINCREAGMKRVFTKPVSLEEVAAAIFQE